MLVGTSLVEAEQGVLGSIPETRAGDGLGFWRGMQEYVARFLFLSVPPDEGERGKLQVNS